MGLAGGGFVDIAVAGRRRGRSEDRMDHRPRQPQPLHRVCELDLRDLGPQLPDTVRPRGRRQADARPCGAVSDSGKRRDLTRWQGLDDPHQAPRALAGRHAADSRRCGLDVQLRGQEPHVERQRADGRHPEREGRRPDHCANRLLSAQSRHGVLSDLHPAEAHLAEGEPSGRHNDLHERPAGDRQRTVRDREVGQGQLPRDGT